MSRAPNVLVQGRKSVEFPITQVALIVLSIPCTFRSDHFLVVVAWHHQHGFGDDIVPVHSADHVIDFGAVEA